MKARKLKEGQARVVWLLHLWCAAPSQRASGKFSRKNLMVGLERCLAEGTRKVFKWLFTCLYNFFFRTQISDQWFLLIGNKLNELRLFCFLANPFMLWCLLNDQRHSRKWQPSLLKVWRPHVQPWVRKRKRLLLPKIPSLRPVATGQGEWAVWCGMLASPTLLQGILLGRDYGSLNIRNLPKWSFLHRPPHLHILGPKTYFEAYIFEICLQQSLKAKAKARVKASWEFSSGDRAGLVLSSYRCWLCIFPLNLGHKVVIWVMLSLQGAPPVDESCLGLMLAVVGRFQSWACNVSGWVTIVGHFVSWIILGLLVPFLGLGPDTQYSGCLKKD